MKANELRIGNFVTIAHETNAPIIEVLSIANKFVNVFGGNSGYDIDFCLPIPLTEEWLLKFGLKDASGYGKATGDTYALSIGRFELVTVDWSDKWHFVGLKGAKYIPIKSVHQLQNLYFALTGEELEVKS